MQGYNSQIWHYCNKHTKNLWKQYLTIQKNNLFSAKPLRDFTTSARKLQFFYHLSVILDRFKKVSERSVDSKLITNYCKLIQREQSAMMPLTLHYHHTRDVWLSPMTTSGSSVVSPVLPKPRNNTAEQVCFDVYISFLPTNYSRKINVNKELRVK